MYLPVGACSFDRLRKKRGGVGEVEITLLVFTSFPLQYRCILFGRLFDLFLWRRISLIMGENHYVVLLNIWAFNVCAHFWKIAGFAKLNQYILAFVFSVPKLNLVSDRLRIFLHGPTLFISSSRSSLCSIAPPEVPPTSWLPYSTDCDFHDFAFVFVFHDKYQSYKYEKHSREIC